MRFHTWGAISNFDRSVVHVHLADDPVQELDQRSSRGGHDVPGHSAHEFIRYFIFLIPTTALAGRYYGVSNRWSPSNSLSEM